jgi:hypothetical protein
MKVDRAIVQQQKVAVTAPVLVSSQRQLYLDPIDSPYLSPSLKPFFHPSSSRSYLCKPSVLSCHSLTFPHPHSFDQSYLENRCLIPFEYLHTSSDHFRQKPPLSYSLLSSDSSLSLSESKLPIWRLQSFTAAPSGISLWNVRVPTSSVRVSVV